METLTILALYGLPVGGVAALGAWLLRSVLFTDVSLKNNPPHASKSAHRAEALDFQLSVAEDLGLDPLSLNQLKEQADNAHEDVERDRVSDTQRQPVPVTIPWLTPVAAAHSIKPGDKQDD